VDVVIPALNEADNIVLCLASVLRQTLKPRRIMLIDDGSNGWNRRTGEGVLQHERGRAHGDQAPEADRQTPTIKRQARELDSDVEFILDADTVLESDNYIERTVQELYQAVGIASAFGTILPQRRRTTSLRGQRSGGERSNRGSPASVHPSAASGSVTATRHHQSLS